jgi:acid phosphatase type 7
MKLQHILNATLLLAFTVVSDAAELRRGPYLQLQRPDGISIRWRTDASVRHTSVLRYGTDFNQLDKAVAAEEISVHYPGVRDWQATLDGLEPDTVYYYALEADRATLCGADANHRFRTSPAPGTARKTRFLLLGDSGSNRPRPDDAATVLAATAPMDPVLVRNGFRKFNQGKPLDGIILIGDNAYPLGTDEMYQAALFNVYADELRSAPLWPCTGNHDIDDAYAHIFTVNRKGAAGGTPSNSVFYYSIDIANLHLVVFDPWMSWWKHTMEPGHQPWLRQMEWLKKDLESTNRQWIMAVNHFPVYCAGNYHSDNELLTALREGVVPLMDEHGVDLFIAGHDHTYQRTGLIAGHAGPANTYSPEKHLKFPGNGLDAPIVKNPGPGSGTMYVVSGTAGGFRPSDKLDHPAMIPFQTPAGEFRGLAVPGSLVIEIDGLTLRGWQVDVHGEILDQFTIVHEQSRDR